jgi:uncharacterized protein (TIGR02594 family)
MNVSAYTIAERFIGMKEIPGHKDNPAILAMLKLDGDWPEHDEVPWCSAFVNYIAWLLRLPRSKSLRARSWLGVGRPVDLSLAKLGFDVVILQRGSGVQPGPDIVNAPGHVGFYAGVEDMSVILLGGNQSNKVSLAPYPSTRILGVRRLHEGSS